MQIALRHVNYIYQAGTINAAPALCDIDLDIAQGELTAVIGHCGSGKSTLALLLAGLYKPTSGQVEIQRDWTAGSERSHQIGLVFQYPEQQLFGETVFEEVAYGARNLGTPNDYLPTKVRQALTMVGLEPDVFWQRTPFMLSGGQKRRVCLASALVMNPQCLILDEPTAGLDESGRRWVMDLVRQLNQAGKTIIWITHNMGEAAELARRVIVLNQGRIVLDGPPSAVFDAEAVLRQARVDVPQAARLVRALKQRGADLPGRAVTVDEAYAEICAWLERRHSRTLTPAAVVAKPSAAATAETPVSAEPELDEEAELAARVRDLISPPPKAEPQPDAVPEAQPEADASDELIEAVPWQGGERHV